MPQPGVPRFRRLALLAGFAALLTAGWLAWRTPRDPALIAVLPFDDLNGDPAQAYFSRGLTEEVITQLGRVAPAGFGVIAGPSVWRYRGTQLPPQKNRVRAGSRIYPHRRGGARRIPCASLGAADSRSRRIAAMGREFRRTGRRRVAAPGGCCCFGCPCHAQPACARAHATRATSQSRVKPRTFIFGAGSIGTSGRRSA